MVLKCYGEESIKMIDFERALELILLNAKTIGKEFIPVKESLSYVLAEDIFATIPNPPYDMSAVDGFALKSSLTEKASPSNPLRFKIVKTIYPGDKLKLKIGGFETVRIMTGAPLPPFFDSVMMKEEVQIKENFIEIKRPILKGENVRFKGEEFKKGDILIKKGTLLNVPHIGLLVTIGKKKIKVYKKPKVSVIVTGNELLDINEKLKKNKIYDSNSYLIFSALKSIFIEPVFIKRVKDDIISLKKVFNRALKISDIIICSGGVAASESDLVKEVFKIYKVKEIFWKVAIKPGKPLYFGVKGKKLIFGLPGNPVAVLLTFYLFVRPAILKISGIEGDFVKKIKAKILKSLKKKIGRTEFLRGILKDSNGEYVVLPCEKQESYMLTGVTNANSLIIFPKEKDFIGEGEYVEVIPLEWRNL
jgi:molybdopterin molybdotransferase